MATQVYSCRNCGVFEIHQPIINEVSPTQPCPTCGEWGEWKPSSPAAIIVEGGSGAGRQMNQRRRAAREEQRDRAGLSKD